MRFYILHLVIILESLGECIGKLSIKMHVPQIEVAIAELDTILILRHLQAHDKGR